MHDKEVLVHFSLNQIPTDNRLHADHSCCPYNGAATGICSASLSTMMIVPSMREGYCENENYDNCPIFLSKILRKKT